MTGDCEETCGAPSYLCTLRKEAPKRAKKVDYGKTKGYANEELKKVIKQLNALKIRVDGFSFDATLGERISALELRVTEFKQENEDDHQKIWQRINAIREFTSEKEDEIYEAIKKARDSIVIPEFPDYDSIFKKYNSNFGLIFAAIDKFNEYGDRITDLERLEIGDKIKDIHKVMEKMDKREAELFKKVWDHLNREVSKKSSSSSSSEDLVDKKDLEKLEKKIKELFTSHKTHDGRIVGLEDMITDLRRTMPAAAEPSMSIDELTDRFRKFGNLLDEKLNRSEYTQVKSTGHVEVKETGSYADKKLTKKTFEMILRKLRSLEEQLNACGT